MSIRAAHFEFTSTSRSMKTGFSALVSLYDAHFRLSESPFAGATAFSQ
jgi:hypothetical protein